MLFNSIHFALFLPIVFFLYWFGAKVKLRLQNIILLISSYFFYACWDWRFLFLLVFSTLLDYYTGIKIHEASSKKNKQIWLALSIMINLGFLGVFKYFNFFVNTFAEGLSLLGVNADLGTLQVILPVGISFYTFHGLSYVIDLYKNKIKPERNLIDYAVFVSFFPLLVAGPIERATHLLPQILKKREFDYATSVDGLRQILWGLFKKIVIADGCAEFADEIFNHAANYGGSAHIIGALFFTVQIYADFSGYTDIAIGTARLFGIEVIRNFAFPYFSRDIAEFWRRWHISLSSWFRDYLYIPLGGSRGGMKMKIRNTFIIFLVSGFWHGANWTFLIWGMLHALYIMPSIVFNTHRNHLDIVARGKILPTINEFFSMAITFSLTVFAWIFFRATDVSHAFSYVAEIFSPSIFEVPDFIGIDRCIPIVALIGLFFILEWIGREQQYAIAKLGVTWMRPLRWAMYFIIVIGILLAIIYSGGGPHQFIYFQF